MGDIRDTANDVYRNYVTAGVPASGENEPDKAAIRSLFGDVEDAILLAGENGAYILKDTKSDLDGDLAHDAGTYALVQFDSNEAQNGYYKKSGESGTGSWSFLGADPRVAAKAAAEAAAADAEGFRDEAEAARDATIVAADAPLDLTAAIMASLGGPPNVFRTDEGDASLDDQTFAAGTWGHIHPAPFATDGVISRLGVNVSASGTGRFFVRDPEGQIVVYSQDVTLASGENNLVGGVDFDLFSVKAGHSLGFGVLTGGGRIKTGPDAAGAQKYFNASSGVPEAGDTLATGALIAAAAPYGMSYRLVSAQNPATDPVEVRARTRVVSQRFPGTSTPAGWTLGSAFAVNSGLESTGSGGWGNYTVHNAFSAVTQRELAARVTFSDAASKWALATRPDPSGELFSGAALVIDGSDGKIGLYAWNTTTPTGVLLAEDTCPTLETGVPYVVRARVDDTAVYGELLDAEGEVVASVSAANFLVSSRAAAFKGALAAIHFGGTVKADWLEAYTLHPKRLKLLIVGDSNLAASVTSGIGPSWGMQLADLRPQKDIMISAVGGDSGQWLSNRQALDFTPFAPEKVLFVLGSNYGSLASWRTDMAAMIAAVVAAGAEPVIATQIPISGSGNQDKADDMNADILGRYFGDLRIADIAAAITDDGDRKTWHWPGTDNGDGIHMSRQGQKQAFEYVRDQCPWLWLDAPNAFLA